MQPYANLGLRWRSGKVIDRFAPTPSRLKEKLDKEYDKEVGERNEEYIKRLWEKIANFGG